MARQQLTLGGARARVPPPWVAGRRALRGTRFLSRGRPTSTRALPRAVRESPSGRRRRRPLPLGGLLRARHAANDSPVLERCGARRGGFLFDKAAALRGLPPAPRPERRRAATCHGSWLTG